MNSEILFGVAHPTIYDLRFKQFCLNLDSYNIAAKLGLHLQIWITATVRNKHQVMHNIIHIILYGL